MKLRALVTVYLLVVCSITLSLARPAQVRATLCGGTVPMCSGGCDTGEVCTGTTGNECSCQTLCGGTAPMCAGACAPGQVCTGADGNACTCQPQCSGTVPNCQDNCPPGQVCTGTTNNPCSCQEAPPTPTPTPTSTPTPTATPTPTPTPTPTLIPLGDACTGNSQQCVGGLCNGGICVQRDPAPAVSNHTAVFVGAALLLAGLWSVRRLARRR